MLYAVVSNGQVSHIGIDHQQAQDAFDKQAKETGDKQHVALVQLQADVIGQQHPKPPPDKAGAPQLTPQELQQLKALLARADAQQKGAGK